MFADTGYLQGKAPVVLVMCISSRSLINTGINSDLLALQISLSVVFRILCLQGKGSSPEK